MDEATWKAYEEKHQQLRAKYRWLYCRTWLIWICYYTVSSVAVWLLFIERNVNVVIYFFVVNTLFSLFLAMRHTAKLRRSKEMQRRSLTEQAPLGKINV